MKYFVFALMLLLAYLGIVVIGVTALPPTTTVNINIKAPLVYVEHDPKELVKQVFGDEWPLAWAIVMAESHGRPDAVGDKHLTYIGEDGKTYGYSVGLFQMRVMEGRPPAPVLAGVYINIMCAYNLKEKRGWTQWGSYNNGSYKQFLPVLKAQLKKEV